MRDRKLGDVQGNVGRVDVGYRIERLLERRLQRDDRHPVDAIHHLGRWLPADSGAELRSATVQWIGRIVGDAQYIELGDERLDQLAHASMPRDLTACRIEHVLEVEPGHDRLPDLAATHVSFERARFWRSHAPAIEHAKNAVLGSLAVVSRESAACLPFVLFRLHVVE